VSTGIGVDIEKLKEIIIDEWQSGKLYRKYYNQGRRGADLQHDILTHLMMLVELIEEGIHEEAVKRSGDPQAATDWTYEYPKSDIRSIGFEVLKKISSAWKKPFERLTTQDIPAILEFLDTPPGKSLEAWDKWEKYWANLNYPERRKKLLEQL
jgi:hypothetical protein